MDLHLTNDIKLIGTLKQNWIENNGVFLGYYNKLLIENCNSLTTHEIPIFISDGLFRRILPFAKKGEKVKIEGMLYGNLNKHFVKVYKIQFVDKNTKDLNYVNFGGYLESSPMFYGEKKAEAKLVNLGQGYYKQNYIKILASGETLCKNLSDVKVAKDIIDVEGELIVESEHAIDKTVLNIASNKIKR